jgi:hypothetical protein
VKFGEEFVGTYVLLLLLMKESWQSLRTELFLSDLIYIVKYTYVYIVFILIIFMENTNQNAEMRTLSEGVTETQELNLIYSDTENIKLKQIKTGGVLEVFDGDKLVGYICGSEIVEFVQAKFKNGGSD